MICSRRDAAGIFVKNTPNFDNVVSYSVNFKKRRVDTQEKMKEVRTLKFNTIKIVKDTHSYISNE